MTEQLVDGKSPKPPKEKIKRRSSKYVAMTPFGEEGTGFREIARGKSIKAIRDELKAKQFTGKITYFCQRGSEQWSKQETFSFTPVKE